MAVPKRKISKSRRGNRRSHHALPIPVLGNCPQCGEAKRSHRICSACGYYKGRPVVAAKNA